VQRATGAKLLGRFQLGLFFAFFALLPRASAPNALSSCLLSAAKQLDRRPSQWPLIDSLIDAEHIFAPFCPYSRVFFASSMSLVRSRHSWVAAI